MPRRLLVPTFVALAAVAAETPLPPAKDTLPADLPCDTVPLGLDDRPKVDPAQARLGRRLFFDPILSADNTVACASCHRPDNGFSGGVAASLGLGGARSRRRAPTLVNRAYGTAFFWDGRAGTLEEQALKPIENPTEMGSSVPAALDRLRAHKEYKGLFEATFADGVSAANLAKSLASFQRVIVRGDSPVDRFRRKGQHDSFTPEERHGLWIYESKGRCWRCHGGSNFSDERFHNTGVSWGREPADLGRFEVTKADADRGKFKTPTLRGVGRTAPYMHDGSLKTLEEVVEFYSKGGTPNPRLDEAIVPLNLSQEEVRSLVAFLKSL